MVKRLRGSSLYEKFDVMAKRTKSKNKMQITEFPGRETQST